MRIQMSLSGLAFCALAACQPAIPDSGLGVPDPGRGVGFDNNISEIRQREADLIRGQTLPDPVPGQPLPPSPAGAAGPVSQPVSQTSTSSDPELARLNAEAAARARAANSGVAPVNASPGNAAPVIVNNPEISSEQDFGAVSSQRSIEADAARIAQNRSQFEVVRPTDLPSRDGNAGPNIVAYALQTSHPRGTQLHRRSGFNAQAKFERNCALYRSADEAQIDFLAQGGPQRDRKGLDPDGDGYACNWDPAPFRRARG